MRRLVDRAVRLAAIAALSTLAACGGDPRAPDEAASTETQLYERELIERRRQFREAIVGHKLRGNGFEVTVAPNGALIGTSLGEPFVGSWEYRRDQFCVSLTSQRVRRADDRQCFHAAINGREVILVPVAPS